jgi:hypothetical protein
MATYGTFVDGVSLKAAEANDFFVWTTFTPVLKQSNTVNIQGFPSTVGRYARVNKLILVNIRCAVSPASTGTANNAIEINLPVAAATTSSRVVGRVSFSDFSPSNRFVGVAVLNSTTTVRFLANAGTSLTSYVGLTGAPTFTLAESDSVSCFLMYETA